MTSDLRARMDPDGRGVLIERRSRSEDVFDLRTLGGVRARARGTAAVVAFEDAVGLLERAELEWESAARRAVENRSAVSSAAPRVTARAREILAGGIGVAQALVFDSRMVDALDPHQIVNLAVLTLPDGWGGCIFDEQGTGKTLTLIATYDLLVERGEADVLLVVCPKTMAAEWAAELRRFTGDLYRVAVAADGSRADRAKAFDSGADVVVVNYETAVSLRASIRGLARRCRLVLAVDESFFVKNRDTVRSTALAEIREWCTRAYVLCGTPAPNAPSDLVAQFNLVDFGFTFGRVRLTGDRAADAEPVREAMNARGLFVRNLKPDVVRDLPNRQYVDVPVALAPKQQAAYDAIRDGLISDLRAVDDRGFAQQRTSFLARRAQLLRLCSDPAGVISGYDEAPAKDVALDELLAELVGSRGEKVVLWSFYRATVDRLVRRFAEYGVARIDGSVRTTAARREAVSVFQDDDDTMLFVGNPAAAGAGITLHRARTAIFESFSNQGAHYFQSLDRVHRRGQTRDVTCITLLAAGTIEEAQFATLKAKADRQGDLLGDVIEPALTREMLLGELFATEQP